MRETEFKTWLEKQKFAENTVRTQISQARWLYEELFRVATVDLLPGRSAVIQRLNELIYENRISPGVLALARASG